MHTAISLDLLDRLRLLSRDEEVHRDARAAIRDALPALERGDADNAWAWALHRAAVDLQRHLGSVSRVVALARCCMRASGPQLVTKEVAR